MAQKRKAAVAKRDPAQNSVKAIEAAWLALTWDQLDRWAGSRSVERGKRYHRQGRVKDLVVDADGRLLATVTGSERYVTSVSIKLTGKGKDRLESTCTCPIGDRCKHGVAVVANYLALLAEEKRPPAAEPDDPRWDKLNAEADDDSDDFDPDDDWDSEDDESLPLEEDEWVDPRAPRRKAARSRKPARQANAGEPKRRTRAQWDALLRSHLESKDSQELINLLWSLIARFPELRQEFQERIELGEGNIDRLVSQARREIKSVTAEMGWRNHWDNEGHTPDYSRLKHRLERLVELGHADAVAELGRDLIRRGIDQVGQSHDEGETAMELGECLEVVFAAVAKSSLSAPQKILFSIDAALADDYGVMDSVEDPILDAKFSAAEWSAVADALADRLSKPASKSDDDFTNKYHRDALSGWLLHALEKAGRKDEQMSVYETEARRTGSYERLVDFLIKQKRFEDAERWAREGIEATQNKYPGIASGLASSLCEVARQQRRWEVVAAHAACQFFAHPSPQGFKQLVEAADKAKCGEKVRAMCLRFLETGRSPLQRRAAGNKAAPITADDDWPLPVPDYLAPLTRLDAAAQGAPRPHFDVLLEMAIAAKHPDEVLRWYDAMVAGKKGSSRGHDGWQYGQSYADRVAAAVAATHPDRALEVYQRALDACLPRADFQAYENAAGYLRKMRPIMHTLDRDDHWNELVKDIREKYRNRPRFMDVLDKLEGRTIVGSSRSSRRR